MRVARAARLGISAAEEIAHRDWLKSLGLQELGYFVIQAGNKRNARGLLRARPTNSKHWPEERWAELICALREQYPDVAILLLGVQQEHALNAQIARMAAVPNIRNLAGELAVPVLLPLLRGARGMFSVDTGPAHAAAALGCPTVALFGVASPALYRPGGVATPAIALTGELDGQPSIRGIRSEEHTSELQSPI